MMPAKPSTRDSVVVELNSPDEKHPCLTNTARNKMRQAEQSETWPVEGVGVFPRRIVRELVEAGRGMYSVETEGMPAADAQGLMQLVRPQCRKGALGPTTDYSTRFVGLLSNTSMFM
jgi:hypothetical protein